MAKYQIVKCDKCGMAVDGKKAKDEGFVTLAMFPAGEPNAKSARDLCGECYRPIPVYLDKKVDGNKKEEEKAV